MAEPPTYTLERRAALAAIIVGVLLMAAKFGAYALTRSAVVFSDAMESIANVLASGVAYYSIRAAHTPADENHPYGHGKFEFISAAFEGGMICIAAAIIFGKAMDQLILRPQTVAEIDVGVILLAATILVNGGMGLWLKRLGTRTGSMALEADGKHLITDAVTSLGTILALVLVWWTNKQGWKLPWIDPALAIIFSAYIAWHGWGLFRKAMAGLTDEQDPKDQVMLEALLQKHVKQCTHCGIAVAQAREASSPVPPFICSFHKLRHRHSGRMHWVEFHIQVPNQTSVEEGHAIVSTLQREIEAKLSPCDATGHVEPCDESRSDK
ncbi:MAG: cation diffusion facilitator family transporter [Phycisphaerales bacterium]